MEPDQPDESTEADLRALLDAERANTAHWRWVAERRISADETLVSRRLVRAAMAIDRRARGITGRIRPRRGRDDVEGGATPPPASPPNRWDGTGPARVVVTICAPDWEVASQWGDQHIARGLADAFERLGHHAEVQTLAEVDGRRAEDFDIEVVVRGLTRVPTRSATQQVLWIISHPEDVTPEECDEADLVLTGSALHALGLRALTTTQVGVMLQATDPQHFRPDSEQPGAVHDVVVVAKTRGVFRPMVRDAIAAGLRPAVHGSGWRRLIDPDLVISERVSYEDLPAVYASASVVLNDHWDTMRAWGFVSNRIFDALACGTMVVSDPVPGLAELFGGAVSTATDPEEVGAAVRRILSDPAGSSAAGIEARQLILDRHTFDHRAEQVLTSLAELSSSHHSM